MKVLSINEISTMFQNNTNFYFEIQNVYLQKKEKVTYDDPINYVYIVTFQEEQAKKLMEIQDNFLKIKKIKNEYSCLLKANQTLGLFVGKLHILVKAIVNKKNNLMSHYYRIQDIQFIV